MRKLFFTLALLVFVLFPVPVQAQSALKFSLVSVNIWPEYDQKAVLVIYNMSLAPGTALPASLSVRIPSGVEISAVAYVDSTKSLINAPYETTVLGQWTAVKLTTSSLQVQIEYYAPLVKNGSARHIVFEWAGDYALDRLDVNFLRPSDAVNVALSLPPTDTGPGADGLTNYHVQSPGLAAGQTFNLTIDYQRNTDELSISSQPVQAVATPGVDTQGRVSMTSILPWVLAGVGVLLIVAGLVVFLAWQRGSQGSSKSKRHASHTKETEKDSEDENVYCHQCGKRAQVGDVFCRTCGTRLRKGSTD